MKIYTRVVFRIDSGVVTGSDSYEYKGPVAHCGGGSKTTINSYDPEYNRRMADIAERQQEMSEEYFELWKSDYRPYEQEQIAANRRMIPHLEQASIAEAQYRTAESESGQRVMPHLERAAITQADLVGERANVAREAYELSQRGLDVGHEVNRARADVASGFTDSMDIMRRDMERMGGSVGDAGWASAMAGLSRDRAKTTAGAMTVTRSATEDKSYARKVAGAGLFAEMAR